MNENNEINRTKKFFWIKKIQNWKIEKIETENQENKRQIEKFPTNL